MVLVFSRSLFYSLSVDISLMYNEKNTPKLGVPTKNASFAYLSVDSLFKLHKKLFLCLTKIIKNVSQKMYVLVLGKSNLPHKNPMQQEVLLTCSPRYWGQEALSDGI